MTPTPVVAVAYSGGRDSTALLHATLRAAFDQGARVVALHVHHGLSAFADAWLAHGERQCRNWARKGLPVEFHSRRLDLRVPRGESIEAVARTARYAALAEMAREAGADLILLAQHRRDQAETFALQALRGAGVAGLAGMAARFERDGLTWARPWLTQPREAIEAYVRRHRLRFVDDDSNFDPRHARNRLRLQVWPALQRAFPGVEAAWADAATWAADADVVLREVGASDLALLLGKDGSARRGGARLPVAGLQSLGLPRARNVMRQWFELQAGMPMPANLLERVVAEWRVRGAASWSAPMGLLRCYRGLLSFEPVVAQSAGAVAEAAPHEVSRELVLSITRAGRHALPGWGGVLQVERVGQGGVALASLRDLLLLPRSGGEQFQLAPGRPARSLKKQYQAQSVPAWEREGPLLYAADTLVFVPGLGVDARAWATEGVAQVKFAWLPSDRLKSPVF